MYPYPILFGMTLYEIFIIIGVIGVMLVFRFLGDRYKFSAKLQNLVLFNTIAAIIIVYIGDIADSTEQSIGVICGRPTRNVI